MSMHFPGKNPGNCAVFCGVLFGFFYLKCAKILCQQCLRARSYMTHAIVIVLLAVATVFGLYAVVSILYCIMVECARGVSYSTATPSAARGEQAAHDNHNQHHDAAPSTRLGVDSKEETRLRVSDAEHTDTCCICLVTPHPQHDTPRHPSSPTAACAFFAHDKWRKI